MRIIKPGETGYGIMIENEGWISSDLSYKGI